MDDTISLEAIDNKNIELNKELDEIREKLMSYMNIVSELVNESKSAQ